MERYDEDIQLMLKFKEEGSESYFEELVQRYKNDIFRIAFYFLKDRHEAEDVAQEVFIKVYKNKDKYNPTAKLSTWLFSICKNTCLNRIRGRKPIIISLQDKIKGQEADITQLTPDIKAELPSDTLIRQEKAEIVKDVINSLPPQQRMAVILRRYENLSYADIAKVMDTSVKAVKSLLHRAKLTLKERLMPYI